MGKVSDIPFNKITDMITSLTGAKTNSRIHLIRELNEIKTILILIEEEKKEAKKKK